jgi:hypothetical protein
VVDPVGVGRLRLPVAAIEYVWDALRESEEECVAVSVNNTVFV